MPILSVTSGLRTSSTDVVLLGRFELSENSRTEKIIGYLVVLELLYLYTYMYIYIYIYKYIIIIYSSPNIVRVIKSRRMRWAGHVARMGEERGRIGSWWGNRKERENWGDLGVDGWIILGWISRRWDVGMWTGLGWPRIETGVGRL